MSKNQIDRKLNLDIPENQSIFFWGARGVGKSTYLKNRLPNSAYFDLLISEKFLRYSSRPETFREEVLALPAEKKRQPIIVDEIQKIPQLLNDIHSMIENENLSFILCGSSARKLRRSGVNLLGGRAWPFSLYPLTSAELPNIDLLKVFNNGLIPSHYLAANPYYPLKAYVETYLTEEIQMESLTRNLPAFTRFLNLLGFANTELVNYSNMAQDCAVSAKTIKEYFQIIIDTLIGYFIYPYKKNSKRQVISATPKFYLFDVGVANYIANRSIKELKGTEAGHSLENFILMELLAYKEYKQKRFDIRYWQSQSKLEVDFILGDAEAAVEVKISSQVRQESLRGLITFCKEHPGTKAYVVSQDSEARLINTKENIEIHILPWRNFLKELWLEKII